MGRNLLFLGAYNSKQHNTTLLYEIRLINRIIIAMCPLWRGLAQGWNNTSKLHSPATILGKKEYKGYPRLIFCDPNVCWMPFLGDLKEQLQAKTILCFNSWNSKNSTQVQSWLEHVVIEFFQILEILTIKKPTLHFAPFPKECQHLFTCYRLQADWQERLRTFFSTSACESRFGWTEHSSCLHSCKCRDMYVRVCVWWWWWWWLQRSEFPSKNCLQ